MTSPTAHAPVAEARTVIVALAVLQSALLLLAHEAIDREWWLARHNGALVTWYTLAVAVPGTLFLLLREANRAGPWLLALALALVLLPQAWYAGHACSPAEAIACGDILGPFFLTQAIAWFVLVHFLQVGLDAGRPRFDYRALFEYGWYNALTLAFAAVFLGIFWLLLRLWIALFELVGIDFFAELFTDRRFAYPVSGLVVGFGIVIARSRIDAVTTVRQILLAIFHALLPLLAAIALLFLVALAFTGVEPLWDTWSAATLLGWLILVSVIFVNAVYQDGEGKPPYPVPVRLAVEAALLILPVFAALAVWALYLRVDQYGWTVGRLWGLTVLSVLTAYAVAYAIAVLWRGPGWLPLLRRANVLIALLLLGLLWLVDTPLLDFRRITVADQIDRLRSGETDMAGFDYRYFRFELGRPGVEALRKLRDEPPFADDPVARNRIDSLLAAKTPWQRMESDAVDEETLRQAFLLAEGSPAPDTALLRAIAKTSQANDCLRPGRQCMLLRVPLYRDGGDAWLLVFRDLRYLPPQLFAACEDGWCQVGRLARSLDEEDIELLRQGEHHVRPPRFGELGTSRQRYYTVVPQD